MAIAVLLALGLAWWLHRQGVLMPNLARLLGTGAAGLIALRMLETGRPLFAIIAGGTAWAWWQLNAPPTPEQRARKLLQLAPGADASAIYAAWRARMAEVHPDAGGSTEAAQAMTDARDLLLSRLEPR